MADQQRDLIQNQNVSFNPAQPMSLVSPNQFHYPQLYVDPSTLYHRSTPPASQPVSHPHHLRLATTSPVPQPHHPYYIPDITTVALQQMQLQTMLQLHQPREQQQQQQQSIPIPQSITSLSQPQVVQGIQHSQTVPESQMASAYRIGRYTPAERKIRLERYREKRAQRNYNRRVKYDCRKQIADKRRRVQGRFVKREEEIALAAEENDQYRSEATDATGEDTKIPQPDSSASLSSVRHIEHASQDDFCDAVSNVANVSVDFR